MNKSIYLVFALLCLIPQTLASSVPEVGFNFQTYWVNVMTLLYVQHNLFYCLAGSTFSLFWGDNGDFFYKCFDNFVARAQFY
jgi:hypothetical protein